LSVLQGNAAENKAVTYLEEQGLTLRCRNYRTKRGELDIVMQDGDTIVCVEVKFRKKSQYGQAAEFVTMKKLQRIQAAFAFYLLDNNFNPASTPLRIDVIAIDGSDLQWLKNIG
jgi:putative endonuclease